MESWWDLGEASGSMGTELATYQIECPFCSIKGNFKTELHLERQNQNGKVLNYDTLRCENCGNFTMVFWSCGDRLHDYRTAPWPLKQTKHPESWPEDVGRYWRQAKQNQAAENYDAAAVMTRSALQLALRHAKAEGDSLYKEIEYLTAKGELPPLMKDWAHGVRLLGNDPAHPKPGEPPTSKADVRDALSFLNFLLQYLFTLPHDIRKFRNRDKGAAA